MQEITFINYEDSVCFDALRIKRWDRIPSNIPFNDGTTRLTCKS